MTTTDILKAFKTQEDKDLKKLGVDLADIIVTQPAEQQVHLWTEVSHFLEAEYSNPTSAKEEVAHAANQTINTEEQRKALISGISQFYPGSKPKM